MGPQAEGACCPPRSPPVRVAAPASIRLGAGRGPHGLASSACTPVDTDVRVRAREGRGGFRVLAPPHLGSVHAPRQVRPNSKVGNKKRITQEKKYTDDIRILCIEVPLRLQNRGLRLAPAVILLPLTPTGLSPGPTALLPLARGKQAAVGAPGSRRSGSRPAPSRRPPHRPPGTSQAAPCFRPLGCNLPDPFPGRVRGNSGFDPRSALLAAGGEVREGKVWSARGAGGERRYAEPGRRLGKRGENPGASPHRPHLLAQTGSSAGEVLGRGHCQLSAFRGHLPSPPAPAGTELGAPACVYVTVCVRDSR